MSVTFPKLLRFKFLPGLFQACKNDHFKTPGLPQVLHERPKCGPTQQRLIRGQRVGETHERPVTSVGTTCRAKPIRRERHSERSSRSSRLVRIVRCVTFLVGWEPNEPIEHVFLFTAVLPGTQLEEEEQQEAQQEEQQESTPLLRSSVMCSQCTRRHSTHLSNPSHKSTIALNMPSRDVTTTGAWPDLLCDKKASNGRRRTRDE